MLITLFLCLIFTPQAFSKTLIVSDSHGTGAFGIELSRQIEKQGESVSFYAFGGTKVIDWIEGNNLTWGFWEHHTGRIDRRGTNRNTPKLIELIETHNPNTVIIVQGTNMIWREQAPMDTEQMRFLMNSAKESGAKCIWIGQPDLNPKNDEAKRWDLELQNLFEKEVPANGCQLIRSWAMTNYPDNMGDGIHYDQIPRIGEKLAREWAQKVYGLIQY
jgi:hypothetical protein